MRKLIGAALLPTLLFAAGVSLAGEHVALEKVPAPVRATIQRETKGGHIESIEKDVDEGVQIYEVELTQGGKKFELHIAVDGKLLERRPD